MKLVANGKQRRFTYLNPRPGLAAFGVKRGDTAFEGARTGSGYAGTAYVFTKGCDPQGFEVSGTVSSDERTITVRGKRPDLSKDCRVTRSSDDTFVFQLPGG